MVGLSAAEVAREKGVTVQAVHAAIARGYLELVHERPKIVSTESAAGWEPDRRKQEAGKFRGTGGSVE